MTSTATSLSPLLSPPPADSSHQAFDEALAGVEDLDLRPGVPAERRPEGFGDIGVVGAGEPGVEGDAPGESLHGPQNAFLDEARHGRRIGVFVDDRGQAVARLRDDAPRVDAPQRQLPDVLA